MLVRKGGFEPPRLTAPPPQDGASASSATSAQGNETTQASLQRQTAYLKNIALSDFYLITWCPARVAQRALPERRALVRPEPIAVPAASQAQCRPEAQEQPE
jgi:hypothetical protein